MPGPEVAGTAAVATLAAVTPAEPGAGQARTAETTGTPVARASWAPDPMVAGWLT